ncbi:hypothetical protein H8959_011382 [Pygathrix nigripes]
MGERSSSHPERFMKSKTRIPRSLIRHEADAKRLQTKEEELLKRKEALRNRLAQLRKERKDLRAAIEVNAGMKDCFLGLGNIAGNCKAGAGVVKHAACRRRPGPDPPLLPEAGEVMEDLSRHLVLTGGWPLYPQGSVDCGHCVGGISWISPRRVAHRGSDTQKSRRGKTSLHG